MNPLTIVLGGLTLPHQASLIETSTPKDADIETLDGTLHTDFTGFKRSWNVTMLPLCRDDFNALYAIYRSQYSGETYLTFVCEALGIDTVVKASLSDQDIRLNGDRVQGVSLTLREQHAIS